MAIVNGGTGSGSGGSQPDLTLGSSFLLPSIGSVFACGVDDIDEVGWFAATQFFTSLDNVNKTAQGKPAAAVGSKVVRFGNYVYADGLVGGLNNLFRAEAPSIGGSPVAWSASLLATAGTVTFGPCLEKSEWGSNDFLFMAEYGNPAGGPSIWRSPDGTTWTKVLGPIAGLNHFHAVAPDPYNPGHVYATAGDGDSKVLYRSTDYGTTWTLLISDNTFQGVQISFTEDYVWVSGDSHWIACWVINRANPTVPLIACTNAPQFTAVPGGGGGRGPFSDGVLTASSATFTSATAAFTPADVGKFLAIDAATYYQIDQSGGIYIAGYTNATTVTLNKAALGSVSGVAFKVGGDVFYQNGFYGAVDPATGIFYTVMSDGTLGGNTAGLFYLPKPGGRFELLQPLSGAQSGPVYFRAGSMWIHQIVHPLLTTT